MVPHLTGTIQPWHEIHTIWAAPVAAGQTDSQKTATTFSNTVIMSSKAFPSSPGNSISPHSSSYTYRSDRVGGSVRIKFLQITRGEVAAYKPPAPRNVPRWWGWWCCLFVSRLITPDFLVTEPHQATCMSTDIPRIPASTSDLQSVNETNPAWLQTSLFASPDIQYLYFVAI